MPGTPDPVLGSEVLTHGIAVAVGLFLVASVVLIRSRTSRVRRSATLLGIGYAFVTLAVWFGSRVVTDAFPSGFIEDLPAAAGFLVFSAFTLAGFVVAVAWLYARHGLVAPLIGLFGITELVWWAFLHVRGETDALGMFIMFGPLLMLIVLLFAGLEYAGRRLWKRFGRSGDGSRSPT